MATIPTWRTSLVREGRAEFKVNAPHMAAQVLVDLIGDRPQEVVAVVALDTHLRPIGASIVTVGTTDEAPVDIPAVLRFVLLTGAPRFVIGHNHPSGSTTPSKADIASMQRVRTAAQTVGLELVDALILGDQHFSLQDSGLLEEAG